MPLSELLVWIQTNNRSGLITINRDGSEWELVVDGRHVIGYTGPELRDNLGHIVVTSGMLTEEDLRVAYQHRREHGGTLQGAFLSQGMLTRGQLEECLRELATEAIYDLFIDLPGEFVFGPRIETGIDLDIDDEERLPLHLDVNFLLMEGARRQDEWNHIRHRFPRDDIQVEVDYDTLPPIEQLGVRERRVLASLSAGQSVSDICLEMRQPIPSVLRLIAQFAEKGGLKVLPPRQEGQTSGIRVEKIMEQSVVMLEAEQFDEAIALLEVAIRMSPTDESIRLALRDAIQAQLEDLYRSLPPVRMPVLVAEEERLRGLRLRPEERFLVQRLAAKMDIGSLVMVSSMGERDTLKTLRKLLHSGLIELR